MCIRARFLDRAAKRENRRQKAGWGARRIAFRAADSDGYRAGEHRTGVTTILFPLVSTNTDWQYFIEVGVLCSAEKHAVDLDGVELVPAVAAARKQNARGAAFRDDGACGPSSSGDRCSGHASGHCRSATATGAGGAGAGGEGAGREGATATRNGKSGDEGTPPGRGREIAQTGRGQRSRCRPTKSRLLRSHCTSDSTGNRRERERTRSDETFPFFSFPLLVSPLFPSLGIHNSMLTSVLFSILFRAGVSTLERARQSRLPTTASALEDLEVVASRDQSSRETAACGRAVAQLSAESGA